MISNIFYKLTNDNKIENEGVLDLKNNIMKLK